MAPELKIFQEIGYDVATIGNHEFDYGTEGLVRYLNAAGYPEAHHQLPIVASNTIPCEKSPLAKMGLKRSYIKEINSGLKIGFIGLLGEYAVKDIKMADSVEFQNHYETAERKAEILKNKGADIIVVLSHSGLMEDNMLAEKVSEIDIIIGGHSHHILEEPVIKNDTIIVQAGSDIKYLGVLELSYNRDSGSLIIENWNNDNPFLIPINNKIIPDQIIKDKVDYYQKELNKLVYKMTDGQIKDIFEKLAYTPFPLKNEPTQRESNLGNLISDAMRIVSGNEVGTKVDLAFIGSSFINCDIIPAGDEMFLQQFTLYDLAFLVSIGAGYDERGGYPLTSFYLKGGDIWRLIEISTLLPEFLTSDSFLDLDQSRYAIHMSGIKYTYNPHSLVLFNIPLLNIPLPSFGSVNSVEFYSEKGIQSTDHIDFLPLKRDKLYHVVGIYDQVYFASLIGNMIPFVNFIIRDEQGREVSKVKDTIIRTEDNELKLWEVLYKYISNFPKDDNGRVMVPDYYSQITNRVQVKKGDIYFTGGMIRTSYKENYQQLSPELNFELTAASGYYAGFIYEFMYKLHVGLFYEQLQNREADYSWEIKGVSGSLIYNLDQYDDIDIYIKASSGYYSGNYIKYEQQQRYDILGSFGNKIGFGIEKEMDKLNITAEILYKSLQSEFRGEDMLLNLSGIEFRTGLKYKF